MLRSLGHDVRTALEDGKANQRIPDEEVLRRASELGRVLLTINRRDFKRLHARVASHTGIMLCTADPDFVGQAQRVDAVLREIDDLRGQLLRVYRPSM